MIINLKKLFNKYNIRWRDVGPNTAKGHINITCPYCGISDKGYHLAINLTSKQWYCFRNPKHASSYLPTLLRTLKIPSHEFKDVKQLVEEKREIQKDVRDYSAWQYFEPADTCAEALAYLQSRGYLNSTAIAQSFDLRVSKQGEWSGRLIIPLYRVGWTGRAMRPHIEPRYKQHSNEDSFFFYSNKSASCLVFEGALDAIRAASVTSQFDVIAKCKMVLSDAIIAHLRDMSYESIYTVPDTTVPFAQQREELNLIKSYCTIATVKKLELPKQWKDMGEVPESAARRILLSA